MNNFIQDFYEVNLVDFDRKVQECKNPSLLSKLLEVSLSIQKQTTQRTQVNLVSRMVEILEQKIEDYSENNERDKNKRKLVPIPSLPILLLLLGDTVDDVHNFVIECK